MKTISQIQQEVLATAQVTLDELQASIEKFWEQGWERNEEAKRTCQSSKWYANNISRVIRDYASYKNLYEKILSGEYVSQHHNLARTLWLRLRNNSKRMKSPSLAHSITSTKPLSVVPITVYAVTLMRTRWYTLLEYATTVSRNIFVTRKYRLQEF